jgi:YD repeat-containing protein
MDALVHANGNRTKWERDVQGRFTREIRADATTDTLYTYDLAGRLKTITDPKDGDDAQLQPGRQREWLGVHGRRN